MYIILFGTYVKSKVSEKNNLFTNFVASKLILIYLKSNKLKELIIELFI